MVYVYNMDATVAGKVDVFTATKDTRPSDGAVRFHRFHGGDPGSHASSWRTCVRDASWHPNAPVIAGRLARILTLLCWISAKQMQPLHGMDMIRTGELLPFIPGMMAQRMTRLNLRWSFG